MKRRDFVIGSAIALIAPRAKAQARQVKVGILLARQPSFYAPGIIHRLGELGYRHGKTITLEQRSADGVVERFPALDRELVHAKCELIFAVGPEQSARALQNAAAPAMVFLAVDYDPIERGLITNLRRPDRNTTGIYIPH